MGGRLRPTAAAEGGSIRANVAVFLKVRSERHVIIRINWIQADPL